MKLSEMTSSDMWNLMLDYYSFYTDEKGGEEDGIQQESDDCD
jgi:hypothetical protein